MAKKSLRSAHLNTGKKIAGNSIFSGESDYYLRKIYLETQLGIPNYGTCGPSTSLNLHTFDVQNTVYPFLKKAK